MLLFLLAESPFFQQTKLPVITNYRVFWGILTFVITKSVSFKNRKASSKDIDIDIYIKENHSKKQKM